MCVFILMRSIYSSKLISFHFLVMILGVLLARKRYPLMKYICVLFIVLGVALFFYKDVSNPNCYFKRGEFSVKTDPKKVIFKSIYI